MEFAAESEALLKDVHDLRTMLIRVGTGQDRIENAEPGYVQVRTRASKNLKAVGIRDPNQFQTLWEWYGYWRSNGLSSYQSRREYVNALYRPMIDAIENAGDQGGGEEEKETSFSSRYGYAAERRLSEVKIREDAPQEIRDTVVEIDARAGLDYDTVFDVASRVGESSWAHPELDKPEHLLASSSSR